jgi:hypothetical protein
MTKRPRGFIADWKPRPKSESRLAVIDTILDEQGDHLPLTIRQIFYMLIAKGEIEKTANEYNNLIELLGRARRAQRISFDAIRDDGPSEVVPSYYDSAEGFWRTVRYTARTFRLDRQDGQDRHLIVWCETAGMVPQLASAVDEYGVAVRSCGGFDSLTLKHDVAKGLGEKYSDVTILHIGDHDQSGIWMFEALAEDLASFGSAFGVDIDLERIAVTPAQIEELGLPSKPDSKSGMETVQAEAIPPAVLRQIVRQAVTDRMDMDLYNAGLKEEEETRNSLIESLS